MNGRKFHFMILGKRNVKLKLKTGFNKVGLSPSKKICFVCFNEGPFKTMKNAFYFIWKALFILKVFKFLSWLFGHVEKTAWLERSG